MKRNLVASLVALGFVLLEFAATARAQAPFEGTVTWAMSIPQVDDEKHDMLVNIKGDKIETELDLGAQGGVKTYLDHANKKIYMYMSSMKAGFVMDYPN